MLVTCAVEVTEADLLRDDALGRRVAAAASPGSMPVLSAIAVRGEGTSTEHPLPLIAVSFSVAISSYRPGSSTVNTHV